MTPALPLLMVLLPAIGSLLILLLQGRTSEASENAASAPLISPRALATSIAIAVLGFVAMAALDMDAARVSLPWFRFQNLDVDFELALRPTRILAVAFVALLGVIASSATPRDARERPAQQAAGLLLALAATLAALLTGDLVVLLVSVEVAILPLCFGLVSRRRADAATSASVVLGSSLVGTAALFIAVLTITNLPLAIGGSELALSASIDETRRAMVQHSTLGAWLVLAFAIAFLPRTMLFPLHWGYTMLQHRFTAGASIFVMLGGVVLATGLFTELALSYGHDAQLWSSPGLVLAVLVVTALAMVGLALSANLRESLRRRFAVAVLVPLHLVLPLLTIGTPQAFALALTGVVAIGLPASSLLLAAFAFAERQDPGRLRDLRATVTTMPRFVLLTIVAALFCFAVPASASWRFFGASFEVLAAHSLPLTILAFAAIAAALVSLVVAAGLMLRSGGEVANRQHVDLQPSECVRIVVPLLAALVLAVFFDAVLEGQTQAFTALRQAVTGR